MVLDTLKILTRIALKFVMQWEESFLGFVVSRPHLDCFSKQTALSMTKALWCLKHSSNPSSTLPFPSFVFIGEVILEEFSGLVRAFLFCLETAVSLKSELKTLQSSGYCDVLKMYSENNMIPVLVWQNGKRKTERVIKSCQHYFNQQKPTSRSNRTCIKSFP